MRVQIAAVDALRRHLAKTVALQASAEIRRRLIAERSAECQAESRRGTLLQSIPSMLDARRRIVLLDEKYAARCQSRDDTREQRVPFADGNLVEDVDDRDRVERSADAVVVADDRLDTADTANFSRVRIDAGRSRPIARQHRQHSMST